MGIFDALTFKKEATKVFSTENLTNIFETARNEIIKQAKEGINKKGSEKKACVDLVVINKVADIKRSCKNKILIWLLDQLIKFIPKMTQLIYDFLKEKVENL